MAEYEKLPPSYGEPSPPPYTPSSSQPEPSERSPLLNRARSRREIRYRESPAHRIRKRLFHFTAIGTFLLIFTISTSLSLISISKGGRDLKEPIRIAVVGAGPAGVGAAWALGNMKLKGGRRVNVTVFEKGERVGGRMVIGGSEKMSIDLEDVATGELVLEGSLLGRRVKEVLGTKTDRTGSKVRDVGFWNGRDMVAVLTDPLKEVGWIRYLGLVWRYGASVWLAKKLYGGESEPEDISLLVEMVDNRALLSVGASDMVKKIGMGSRYTDEILKSQLRRQLGGQDLDALSAFIVKRALAREDKPGRSSGGYFQTTLEKFMHKSRAALVLNTEVIGFKKEEILEGKEAWILQTKTAEGEELSYDNFDHVVLAGPWNSTGLLTEDTSQEEIAYKPTWATFVLSSKKISGSHFHEKGLPDDILPLHGEIYEVSHIRDVYHPENTKHLYRILSENRVNEETFSLFDNSQIEVLEQEIEHAYPLLYPRSDGLGGFEIGEGLWQTGVMERVGSEVGFAWWAGERAGGILGKRLRDEE